MKVSSARLSLFLIWSLLFITYVSFFFAMHLAKKDQIDFEQTADSCWKVIYVLAPILSAFGMYWFIPLATEAKPTIPPDDEILDKAKIIAMFTITFIVHFVVFLYLIVGVACTDFRAPSNTASYTDRVDSGIKMLVFLSSLVGLPVGFLLGRRIHSPSMPDGKPKKN